MRRQTLAPADVLVVEGVRPFHHAVNVAAARANGTPFFVQVDADMILDPTCLASLRAGVRPGIGIVTGALRDPLVGPVNGVKLFRRECFETVQCPDTVSSDSDFYIALVEHGWLTVNVLARPEHFGTTGHTFGEHRPDYTPAYTYATYYLLGRKYSLRIGGAARIRWRLDRLRASGHPVALVARAALGHGAFSGLTRDVAKPAVLVDDELLAGVLNGNGAAPFAPEETPLDGRPSRVCAAFFELGRALRSKRAYSALRRWMTYLERVPQEISWLAEISLHHGFLDLAGENGRLDERLRELLDGRPSSWTRS